MKVVAFVVLCVGTLLALMTPAAAHPGSDTPSTNYRTEVGTVPDSFSLRIIDGGERLELRTTGQRTIVVQGYGEPLYRLGPDGAYENERADVSRSINDGSAEPGPGVVGVSEPSWKKTSQQSVVRWRDARAFFDEASPPNPDPKDAAPTRWVIPAEIDGVVTKLTGTVAHVDGPNPMPKYLTAAFVAVVVIVVGFTVHWKRNLMIALAGLVSVDVVHSLLIAARKEAVSESITSFLSGVYVVAGWAMAVLAIALLRRRTSHYEEPLFFAMFAAVVMGFFAGFADISDLTRSQIAVAGPPELSRWTVALSCGLGTGIFVASLVSMTRSRGHAPNNSPIPTKV